MEFMETQPIHWLILLIVLTDSGFPERQETKTVTEGSCLELEVTKYIPSEDALMFWMKDGKWIENDFTGTVVYSNNIRARPISPEFEARVKSIPNSPHGILICNLTKSDAGTYFFRYSSILDRWNDQSQTLIVKENLCPITLNKYQYSDFITVRCSTKQSCRSQLVLQSGTDLTTSSSRGTPATKYLYFHPSVNYDNREFTCQTKENKDKYLIKRITFYAPRVEVTVSPQPPHTQGETVTLSCRVIQSNPSPHTFYWYKNDQRLAQGQTFDKNLQPEDSGYYKCSAQNAVDTRRSSALQIDVQYKPKNTNIVGESNVALGQSVELNCNNEANPPAHEYNWEGKGVNLRRNTQRLWLTSVKKTDEGCYRCKASNRIGSGDFSDSKCIKVLYPPTKPTLSMNTEVTEGQAVDITCEVDSNPESDLTLSRTSEGSTVKLSSENILNALKYTFTVSSSHSGDYTCHAQNSQGSDSTTRALKVKYRPQKVKVQAHPGLSVNENQTLTLHCDAQSHPAVDRVTWRRGTVEQTGQTDHSLIIKPISVNDSGLYSCTAHNEIGDGTSPPANVTVRFGPRDIQVQRAVEEPGAAGTVTLSCSSNSFPPVSEYTWYRRTKGKEHKVSDKRILTVESAQPGDYYCIAKNEISETRSEMVSLFQDGHYVIFIFLAGVALLIFLLVALFILRRRKAGQEGQSNTSFCAKIMGGNSRNRDDPGPQQQADVANGTSCMSDLYSTVNHTKDKQRQAVSRQQQEDSLNYASLHFQKRKQNVPVEITEEVIYSTVKTTDQETADIYENITEVQKANCPNLDLSYSDSSEDEMEVNYTQVNFSTTGRRRQEPRQLESEEEQYSELKL